MKKLAVETIIIPAAQDLPPEPSVAPGDRITAAVEVMLENDAKRIAVAQGDKVVGMITLKDALEKVGLGKGKKPEGPKSLVFQGRKIIVDR